MAKPPKPEKRLSDTMLPETDRESTLFAKSLLDSSEEARVQHGIVAVFDKLTDLLPAKSDDQYRKCDDIFRSLDCERTDIRLLIALLKGTSKTPPGRLPSRTNVLEIAKKRIADERPADVASGIIQRLR